MDSTTEIVNTYRGEIERTHRRVARRMLLVLAVVLIAVNTSTLSYFAQPSLEVRLSPLSGTLKRGGATDLTLTFVADCSTLPRLTQVQDEATSQSWWDTPDETDRSLTFTGKRAWGEVRQKLDIRATHSLDQGKIYDSLQKACGRSVSAD